ncbi:MAG: aminopeptidase N [Actinomycetota bacterium]|nr:aminopeptidase N [Actinomycetota bacterium]
MSQNITRAEAQERAELVSVDSYAIALDMGSVAAEDAATFGSTTSVQFTSTSPGEPTWIDLIADEVVSAELNGVLLDVQGYDGARLLLPAPARSNELVVRARCWYMNTGEGLHRSVDPADGGVYLYTQFATADARRVFACFEQPDLKGRISWQLTAPSGWEVRANTAAPDPVELGDGLALWTFPSTGPLSTYLAAFCAGPFAAIESQYEGPHGTYPLGILVRASVAEHLDADEVLGITRAGLAHYERAFEVPYPFGKYDQVAIPEFNLGAMENPGLVTFREDLLVFRSRVTDSARESRAMIILHEMAHMWFGDLVTMRWWDDLWLNESFAEWAGFGTAADATRFSEAWTAFVQGRKAWAYGQDQQPSTHPVAADMVDLEAVYLNFDGITYAKGASVIKQLAAFVGAEAFLSGLRRYFSTHAWGSATLADLLVELEATSGRDLQQWAQAWLQAPGVTSLQPSVEVDAHGRYSRVVIEQAPASRPEGIADLLRPHRVAVGVYRWGSDAAGVPERLVRDQRIEVDVLGASVEVPELVGVPAADLLLVNDDDLTYAKVRLDPASLRTATQSVGDLAESLPRSLVWASLWELVRDGLLPAQDFVRVALNGLDHEDRAQTIETVLRQARTATERYVDPELRATCALDLCAGTARLLATAEPGSDRQLALARAHIATAVDPVRLERLVDVLAGRAALPGLPLDADLRWAIVTRLVGRGVAGEDLVDEVLRVDRTSKGEAWAARARASQPTEAAKAAAWHAAVEVGGLANDILEATVAGFADPDGPLELIEPYGAQYVQRIVDLWRTRPPAEGRTLARGLFPGIVDAATVALADSLLGSAEVPSGLRRIIAEERAETVLALGARDVSRAAR